MKEYESHINKGKEDTKQIDSKKMSHYNFFGYNPKFPTQALTAQLHHLYLYERLLREILDKSLAILSLVGKFFAGFQLWSRRECLTLFLRNGL